MIYVRFGRALGRLGSFLDPSGISSASPGTRMPTSPKFSIRGLSGRRPANRATIN